MGYRKNSDRPFASPLARALGIDRVRLTVVLFAWMKAICRHRRFTLKAICSRIEAGILIVRNYFFIDRRHFYFRLREYRTREATLKEAFAGKQKSGMRSYSFTMLGVCVCVCMRLLCNSFRFHAILRNEATMMHFNGIARSSCSYGGAKNRILKNPCLSLTSCLLPCIPRPRSPMAPFLVRHRY